MGQYLRKKGTTMKKGFTILELLFIVSILVILIGIAIPRFKKLQDKGRMAQANAELQATQTAVESYYRHQTPPAYPPSSLTVGASHLVKAIPQIESTPLYDPFGATSTTEYGYLSSSNRQYYVIFSVGANGLPGIKSILDNGTVIGKDEDDICLTNGSGC
jgi:type II secretory pathway pseudopilin PulG